MRTLKLRFPDDALPTLDTFLKQTKEARSSAVPKPCAKSSKGNASKRSRHAPLPIPRSASGSIALPTKASKASSTAPALVARPK